MSKYKVTMLNGHKCDWFNKQEQAEFFEFSLSRIIVVAPTLDDAVSKVFGSEGYATASGQPDGTVSIHKLPGGKQMAKVGFYAA